MMTADSALQAPRTSRLPLLAPHARKQRRAQQERDGEQMCGGPLPTSPALGQSSGLVPGISSGASWGRLQNSLTRSTALNPFSATLASRTWEKAPKQAAPDQAEQPMLRPCEIWGIMLEWRSLRRYPRSFRCKTSTNGSSKRHEPMSHMQRHLGDADQALTPKTTGARARHTSRAAQARRSAPRDPTGGKGEACARRHGRWTAQGARAGHYYYIFYSYY